MDARTLHQVEAELKAAADSTRRDAATHYGQGRREAAASIYRLADGIDKSIEIVQGLREHLDDEHASARALADDDAARIDAMVATSETRLLEGADSSRAIAEIHADAYEAAPSDDAMTAAHSYGAAQGMIRGADELAALRKRLTAEQPTRAERERAAVAARREAESYNAAVLLGTPPEAGKNWGQAPPQQRVEVEPWTDGPEPTAEMADVAMEWSEPEPEPAAPQVDELTMDVADMAPARERNGLPADCAHYALLEHLHHEHAGRYDRDGDLDDMERWHRADHETDRRRRTTRLTRHRPGDDHSRVGARARELARERAAKAQEAPDSGDGDGWLRASEKFWNRGKSRDVTS